MPTTQIINPTTRRRIQRAGLTLIELLVVLFILAAVAGVSLSILPNFQKKTHGSTSAASIRAGESAITANLVTGGVLGDGFDGLIVGGAVPAFIANADGLVPATLDTDSAGALNELGINNIYSAVATPDNATLEGHDYSTLVPVNDTATIAQISSAATATGTKLSDTAGKFNIATPDQIFVFGLGEECTLVGLNRAFKEAPLHTPGEGSAATRYGRYAILVGYNGGTEPEAFYIGLTCIDDFENFNNITNNLGEFFEASE